LINTAISEFYDPRHTYTQPTNYPCAVPVKNKKVELVFERTCPNVEIAREQLREAFARIQQAPYWQEWEVSDNSAPDYIRAYGSPTILVNERDVSGSHPEGKDCCRVYKGEDGHLNVVPKLEDVIRALEPDS
jgi:mercuric ion transport protein